MIAESHIGRQTFGKNLNEGLFAIYLTSGILKGIYLSKGFNPGFDLTAVSAAILLIIMLIQFWRNKIVIVKSRALIRVLPLFAFYFLCLVSLFYSPSEKYGYVKALMFLTNFVALLFPLAVPSFRVNRFAKIMFIIAVVVGIYAAIVYAYYFNSMGAVLGHDKHFYKSFYLDAGYLLGFTFILIMTLKNIRVKIILANITLVLMWVTAARGPIIFAGMVYVLYLTYYFMVKGKKYFLTIINSSIKLIGILFITNVLLFTIAFSLPFTSVLFKRTLYRFSLLIPSNISEAIKMAEMEADSPGLAHFIEESELAKQQSSVARVEHFIYTGKMITKDSFHFTFGYGFGSYGLIKTGEDGRLYPHNIILEIWFELGLIGVLIFLSFLYQSLYWVIKNRRYIVGLSIIYLILNTFKSYSLIDHRIFFGMIGIAIFIPGKEDHIPTMKNLSEQMKKYSLLLTRV